MMTLAQRRLIRESVNSLKDMAGPISLLFYGRVFEIDPSARPLFHNDLTTNGRKVIDTLGLVADSLENFDALRPRLAELGRLHAGIGVKREQYEAVTTALLWAIGHALGPDFDAATREAWRLALAAVSQAMTEGL